jgi:hypothetical protein
MRLHDQRIDKFSRGIFTAVASHVDDDGFCTGVFLDQGNGIVFKMLVDARFV